MEKFDTDDVRGARPTKNNFLTKGLIGAIAIAAAAYLILTMAM